VHIQDCRLQIASANVKRHISDSMVYSQALRCYELSNEAATRLSAAARSRSEVDEFEFAHGPLPASRPLFNTTHTSTHTRVSPPLALTTTMQPIQRTAARSVRQLRPQLQRQSRRRASDSSKGAHSAHDAHDAAPVNESFGVCASCPPC
jgi:hypothetical protein